MLFLISLVSLGLAFVCVRFVTPDVLMVVSMVVALGWLAYMIYMVSNKLLPTGEIVLGGATGFAFLISYGVTNFANPSAPRVPIFVVSSLLITLTVFRMTRVWAQIRSIGKWQGIMTFLMAAATGVGVFMTTQSGHPHASVATAVVIMMVADHIRGNAALRGR